MHTTTAKLTYEEFQKLPEREGVPYELDEGELLMEASPTAKHQLIRARIAGELRSFVHQHQDRLGVVVEEMDFRLGPDTVRNPDVAVVSRDHLKRIDLDRSPIEGAPVLAVEVISPSNLALDMAKKTEQYLAAGTKAVWLVYPDLRRIEIHEPNTVHYVTEPGPLREMLWGLQLSCSLPVFFDPDLPA